MSNVVIYHNNLCPDIWDENYNLNSDIRLNLLKISKDFYEKTKFEAPILDIYFMGSMASFNWNVESDIDIHVVINLTSLNMPEETSEKMAKLVGSQWNNDHEISIKGHKVEMNIQSSTAEKPYVNGIYSLIKNQWIKRPSKQNPNAINTPLIQVKYNGMKKYILDTIATGDREKLKAAKDYLDAFRQYGLDNDGELSVENITYKLLRTKGIIKQLKDAITNLYDKQLSINEEINQNNSEATAKTKNFTVKFGEMGLAKGTAKILLNGEWFANSYKLPTGFGHGKLKDGEWIVNRHEGAFRLKFPEWMISYPTLQELLEALENWYQLNNLKEVTQSNINPKLPAYAHTDLKMLSLSNLKALRDKAVRVATDKKLKIEDPHRLRVKATQDFILYRDEIKRRLDIINRPVTEAGYHDTMSDDEIYVSANDYFSIGQDDDETRYKNSCWIWDGSKIIAKKGGTHGVNFTHDLAGRNFKGWYDVDQNKISVVFPDYELRKLGNKKPIIDDIPTNLYNKLLSKFGNENKIFVFEHILKESVDVDYNAHIDFLERKDTQLYEIATFLKTHKSGNIPWKTISATLLKKTWLLFGKYNKVNENDIDKIADQLLTNIVRLTLANEFTGHSENYHLREEIDEMCDIQFTDEEWEEVCNRFEDKNGRDYISDYGIRPLQNIYGLIFNSKTPEEKLYACDKALNVVHQRNDLAAMFVEGGQATLTQIANQGGYNAGYEYGQMNREFRESLINEAISHPQSQEFKSWFGNSKVVDKSGNPLVVYHGTNQPISAFSKKRLGMNTMSSSAKRAYFFTDSTEVAGEYAASAGRKVRSDISNYEKKIKELQNKVERLEKHAQLTGNWTPYEKAMEEYENYDIGTSREDEITGQNILPVFLKIENPIVYDFKGQSYSVQSINELIDTAIKNGNDGVIMKDVVDTEPASTHYIVFKPNQIKSAIGNVGKFSHKHSSIVKENKIHKLPLSAFTGGYCAEFALALHEKTGYPIVSFDEIIKHDEDDIETQSIHYACKHNNLYYDAKGKRTEEDIRKNLLGSDMKLAINVEIRELTPEYLEGETRLEPEALEQAREIVSRMKTKKTLTEIKFHNWSYCNDSELSIDILTENISKFIDKLPKIKTNGSVINKQMRLIESGHIPTIEIDTEDGYLLSGRKDLAAAHRLNLKEIKVKYITKPYLFEDLMNEVFDVHIPTEFKIEHGNYISEFEYNNEKYKVEIKPLDEKFKESYLIEFYKAINNDKITDVPSFVNQLNARYGKSDLRGEFKIFSYVLSAINEFIKLKSPNILSFFTTDEDRNRIYFKFIKKYLDGKYEFKGGEEDSNNGKNYYGIAIKQGLSLNQDTDDKIKTVDIPTSVSGKDVEVKEGFGGNPDTDKAYVKNDRWTVKYASAGKTPKIK